MTVLLWIVTAWLLLVSAFTAALIGHAWRLDRREARWRRERLAQTARLAAASPERFVPEYATPAVRRRTRDMAEVSRWN